MGNYTLETVVPGLYPGRTRHIHVKVQAPNGPVLTTQLYFPNEPRNATDGIFDATLVLPIEHTDTGQICRVRLRGRDRLTGYARSPTAVSCAPSRRNGSHVSWCRAPAARRT